MHKRWIFFLALMIMGCSLKPKQTDLTHAVLMKLNSTKVNEIVIVGIGKKTMPYIYEYSLRDPEKIDIILRSMHQATQIHDEQPLRRSARPFIFKTRKAWYGMRIGWDDDVVYGDWICPTYSGRWESAELLKHFKQWNLEEEIAAADPNLPPPDWITNPPKFEDTMPPMPLFPGKTNIYLSEEVFSALAPSKVIQIKIITISGTDPADWKENIFSITDTETIKKIMQIIATSARNPPEPFGGSNLVLETEDTFYYTGMTWNDNTVFGDWWESGELYTLLHSLGLPNHKQ